MENTLGFVRGGFGFVEGDMLHFSHVRGVDGVVDLPLSHRGISVRAVKTGETQFVADIRNDDDYVDGDVNGRLETLSEIDVPVKVRGDVAAVLNVESERLNAYTSEDEKLLEIFSEHVASAISRIKQIDVIKEAEETYSKLLDSSMELVALVSGTTITYLNKWSVEKLGYESPNDLIGEDITKVIAQEKLAEIRDRALSRQRGEPQPTRYELLLKAKSGRVVSVDASFSIITQQGKSQILVIGRDISSMKRQSRQLAALHRHATRLAEARTKEEIISATLDAAESVVGYHFLSILEPVEDALVITSSRGYHTRTLRLPLDGKGLTVRAAREKRSILTYDTLTDPNYVRGAADSRSELDVPVIVNGEIVAVINVESMEINAFDEVDKTLMETLALHVASALQRRLLTKKLPKSKTRESKNQQ
jgi:PAS domain S-box-containing protein